jgi:hypothetical protein
MMDLKWESSPVVMAAVRAAVRAAEHEGRFEFCTDQQAIVNSNSNTDCWSPHPQSTRFLLVFVLNNLHFSTVGLEYKPTCF